MKGTLSGLGCPYYSATIYTDMQTQTSFRGVAIDGFPSGSVKRLGDHERTSVLSCLVLWTLIKGAVSSSPSAKQHVELETTDTIAAPLRVAARCANYEEHGDAWLTLGRRR
jgi:hypothetical protein